MAMVLKVNGEDRQFEGEVLPGTVAELLKKMGIDEATVVAEVDGEIVERKNFGKAELKEGASVELVRFVGGG
jgi:thiamine biosynthesis protein ThiS